MTRAIAAAALAACLVAAGPAGAATVSVETGHPCDGIPPDEVTPGCDEPPFAIVSVVAAPGEANALSASATGEPGRRWEVRVADAGAAIHAGPGCVAGAPGEIRCEGEFSSVRFAIRAGDGDDRVEVAGATGALVEAGPGADDVTTAAGFDALDGGPGADVLRAGAGDDLLVDGDAGAVAHSEALDGGPGSDRVSYARRRAPVRVDLRAPSSAGSGPEGDVLTSVERASGGRGDDLLRGGPGRNALAGGRGADRLACGAGIDLAEDSERADELAGDCERAGDARWLTIATEPSSARGATIRLRAWCSDVASAEHCRGALRVRRPGGGARVGATPFAVPRGRSRAIAVALAPADVRTIRRGGLRVELLVRLELPADARGSVRRLLGYTTRFGG